MLGLAPEPIPIVVLQPLIVEEEISEYMSDLVECSVCLKQTKRIDLHWNEGGGSFTDVCESCSIVRDVKYDAVIAEINAGVCSLDNAIRINKHQIKVHTYVNPNTQIKKSHLRYVERFGMCPHQDFKSDSAKDPYIVGNIFGETKLRLTPDGEIIYDRTYFKGKDKQKYFATRWLGRPESSGWQNCFLGYLSGYFDSGIEILGMEGRRLTKDGKYKYEGVSIAHLKDACKMNGIKGTSGKDKHELVKLLMKI